MPDGYTSKYGGPFKDCDVLDVFLMTEERDNPQGISSEFPRACFPTPPLFSLTPMTTGHGDWGSVLCTQRLTEAKTKSINVWNLFPGQMLRLQGPRKGRGLPTPMVDSLGLPAPKFKTNA